MYSRRCRQWPARSPASWRSRLTPSFPTENPIETPRRSLPPPPPRSPLLFPRSEAFSRYLDPAIADLIAEQRVLPKLEGENRLVTAFFSDIRGFTAFTEQFKDRPDQIIKMLNVYLTRVTGVLQRNLACVDKYIGD